MRNKLDYVEIKAKVFPKYSQHSRGLKKIHSYNSIVKKTNNQKAQIDISTKKKRYTNTENKKPNKQIKTTLEKVLSTISHQGNQNHFTPTRVDRIKKT